MQKIISSKDFRLHLNTLFYALYSDNNRVLSKSEHVQLPKYTDYNH